MTTPQPILFPVAASGNQAESRTKLPIEDDTNGALEEIRATIEKLKDDVSTMAERRAMAVSNALSDGAEHLSGEIRKAPGAALVIAAIAGILVGIAVTRARPAPLTWHERALRLPAGIGEDWNSMTGRARGLVDDARSSAAGLLPSVERLAQTLSQMDVNSTLAPALEKGTTLLKTAWQSLTSRG